MEGPKSCRRASGRGKEPTIGLVNLRSRGHGGFGSKRFEIRVDRRCMQVDVRRSILMGFVGGGELSLSFRSVVAMR